MSGPLFVFLLLFACLLEDLTKICTLSGLQHDIGVKMLAEWAGGVKYAD